MNTTLNNSLMVKKTLLKANTSNLNQNKVNNTTTLQFINSETSINNNLNQLAFLGMSHIKKTNLSFQNDNEINDYGKYLSNYDNAVKLVNNPEALIKFFSAQEHTQQLFKSNKATDNFAKAMEARAIKDIERLSNIEHRTPKEEEELLGAKVGLEIFGGNYGYCDDIEGISFKGKIKASDKIDPAIKQECANIINQTTATCSAISGGTGAMGLTAVDEPFLRLAQITMLSRLAAKLNNVGDNQHKNTLAYFGTCIASTLYTGTKMAVGSTLGIAGAKLIIGGAGLLGASSSGGGSLLLSSLANGSLSSYITRKMGWDYVEQLLDKKMTIGQQAKDAALSLAIPYAAPKIVDNVLPEVAKGLINGFKEGADAIGIDTTQVGEAISNINQNINYTEIMNHLPKDQVKAISNLTQLIPKSNLNNTGRTLACVLTGGITANTINAFVEHKAPPTLKEIFIESACITMAAATLGVALDDMSNADINKVVQEKATGYAKLVQTDPKTFLPLDNTFNKFLGENNNYPTPDIKALNKIKTENIIRVCGEAGGQLNQMAKNLETLLQKSTKTNSH